MPGSQRKPHGNVIHLDFKESAGRWYALVRANGGKTRVRPLKQHQRGKGTAGQMGVVLPFPAREG